jgi:hypothetical protein
MKSGIRYPSPHGAVVVVVGVGSVGVVVGAGGGAGPVVPVVTGDVVAVVPGGAGATVATVAGCLEVRDGGCFLLRRVATMVAGPVVDGDVWAGGRVVVTAAPVSVDVGWPRAEDFDAWRSPDEQEESDAASATRTARKRSAHRLFESFHRPTPPDRTPAGSTDGRRRPNSRRDQSMARHWKSLGGTSRYHWEPTRTQGASE